MKIIVATFFVVLTGVLVAISVCNPAILAENGFLKAFLHDQVLNILAVIMTISIASIATIHIWFNELEDKHQQRVFGKARREINHSAFFLIGLFVGELVLLIFRSFFDGRPVAISLFDSAALIVLLMSVATLIDIMGVVRSLTPDDSRD